MINRFFEKLKDPRERKLFAAILGGKTLGLGLCLLVISVVSFYLNSASKVHAQTASPSTVQTTASPSASPLPTPEASPAPAATPAPNPPYVNPINTMWVLVTAFLVFFMQAGFMFLEAGFARTRESVNVMLEGIVDTSLCGILFYCWGFAWMFGHGNGFIGWGDGNGHIWYFLQNLPDTYESTGVATIAVFLFQFAFADTCSTITSGAMVGRTGFWGDLWYSLGVSGFIYPHLRPLGLGSGRLAQCHSVLEGRPFHDFAGSTVVHTIGGTIALAGAIVLGPRLGRKFKRDGGGPMPAHNMLIASVGAIILWFGWYGFNPGSTLSAMDYHRRCPRGDQYHAGGLRRRSCGDVLRLSARQEVGLRHVPERPARGPRGDHLPMLLGFRTWRDHDRRRGRCRGGLGHRSAGMAAH